MNMFCIKGSGPPLAARALLGGCRPPAPRFLAGSMSDQEVEILMLAWSGPAKSFAN